MVVEILAQQQTDALSQLVDRFAEAQQPYNWLHTYIANFICFPPADMRKSFCGMANHRQRLDGFENCGSIDALLPYAETGSRDISAISLWRCHFAKVGHFITATNKRRLRVNRCSIDRSERGLRSR